MSFERSYNIESHERIKLILIFGNKSLLLTCWVTYVCIYVCMYDFVCIYVCMYAGFFCNKIGAGTYYRIDSDIWCRKFF